MEEDIYLDKLDRRGIKPTAIRLLVIKAMMQAERAVSLLDLETLLDTVDDGSGSLKYAVCDNSCNCVVQDLHSHFYCEKCHRTFCLEGTHIPVIDLPKGFTLHSINYVLKGVCSECTSQK